MDGLTRRSCLAFGLAAALAGCAGRRFDGRTLRLTRDELERLAVREFPIERRLLEVVDVALAAPRLELRPERQRIAAEMPVAVRERLFDGAAAGRLAFDAALHWRREDRTLRLAEVRVERFDLDAGGSRLPLPAERLGALLAERALDGAVVWRMKPEDAEKLQRLGVEPERIVVEADAIEVRFQPVGPG